MLNDRGMENPSARPTEGTVGKNPEAKKGMQEAANYPNR